MATKVIARHDRIEIDGTDYSNNFRQMGLTSEDSDEDVSGFSISGVDETLPGTRAQGFEGELFYDETIAAALWALHNNRTVVEVLWQPNGLIDGAALTYYGNCTIGSFAPSNTRGSASTMPFSAKVADENGVTQAAGT